MNTREQNAYTAGRLAYRQGRSFDSYSGLTPKERDLWLKGWGEERRAQVWQKAKRA